jgi:hypothetical protein
MRNWLSVENLEKVARLLWGLLLFTVPVTTFRYIPSVYGRTLVRPMALYPLALLFPLFLWLSWRKRKFSWPPHREILFAFLLLAMLATLLAGFRQPVALRGAQYWERALRAWFSLGVGFMFFLCAFWMNRSSADLRYSLGWLYAALILTTCWSSIQALGAHTSLIDQELLTKIQLSFSDRPLARWRASGFAYEPAWLADQLLFLYFPWLLGAILFGFRLTRYRWLEPLLLLFTLGVMVLTYSRSGILIMGMIAVLAILSAGRKWLIQAWKWFTAPFSNRTYSFEYVMPRAVVILMITVSMAGVFAFLSKYEYFANLWNFDLEEGIVGYVVGIYAGPRLAYAWASVETYMQNPLSGVGLGASGFYLYDNLPNWALFNLPEIARQISPDASTFPNTKNMYVRLLAETGLFGFWFFSAFLLGVLGSVRKLFKQNIYLATAGLCIWLAVVLRNITQDSFTFPVMWIALGMFLGLSTWKSSKTEKKNSVIG